MGIADFALSLTHNNSNKWQVQVVATRNSKNICAFFTAFKWVQLTATATTTSTATATTSVQCQQGYSTHTHILIQAELRPQGPGFK